MAAKKQQKERRKHALWADGSIPPDHKDNRWCRRCRVMGKPGDQRHTEEFPDVPADDVTNRILGENE